MLINGIKKTIDRTIIDPKHYLFAKFIDRNDY